MSKQHEANNTYEHGIEAGFSRKQIINEISIEVGVSLAYASTLYNNARKSLEVSMNTQAPTAPVAPTTSTVRMTSSKIDEVQADIKAALEAVLAKHGMSASFGNVRYKATDYSTRMTINVGNAEDAAKADFAKNCSLFGLKPTDYGRQFRTSGGKTFTITGINPGRRKYPISGESARGARYKFPANQVVSGLV